MSKKISGWEPAAEEGRKIVEAHIKRAQGLQSFLKT
jgi:hypothetical protein